jgi:type II secretory pathway component GspD/PulD (secretin)
MADPRTRSVVVVASRDLLDQIDGMITQLDHAGRTQQIAVIPVQNGNPNEMVQALQDVVGSRSTSSLNTQLDPFRTRVQQNNQNYSQSVFGNSGFGGNRGGNFGGGGAFR